MGTPAGELTVVSLNTLGLRLPGTRMAWRYAAIGGRLEAGGADVACLQEVLTWQHLRLLARQMPSFGSVAYRPRPAGPAGGLVVFSRRPVAGTAYRAFGVPPPAPGISRWTRLRACLKGALVTRLENPGLAVINTHPVSNSDGDWSPAGRFYPVHRVQLGALGRVLDRAGEPAVVCGDFNVARDSSLFGEFAARTGLTDAFGGTCPATFRAEFLPAGATPHCIDFILTAGAVKAVATELLFTGREPMPGGPGFVSDHLGLCARLALEPAGTRPYGHVAE